MNKRVLVIDDDHLILYGLRKALHQEAVEVTTASSGELALEEISLCAYDLCLLDIHLGDYNGLELMKIITRACPHTKVIIMTASYMGDDELSANIKQAAQNGAYHFITKPFDLDETKDIIHQALHDRNFHTGIRFTDNAFVKKTRKFSRRTHAQQLDISMTILGEGETQRWLAGARSVDISAGGIGVVSRYPLRVSQIIHFRADLAEKTGIVVWSTMQEDSTCRAGVRFA